MERLYKGLLNLLIDIADKKDDLVNMSFNDAKEELEGIIKKDLALRETERQDLAVRFMFLMDPNPDFFWLDDGDISSAEANITEEDNEWIGEELKQEFYRMCLSNMLLQGKNYLNECIWNDCEVQEWNRNEKATLLSSYFKKHSTWLDVLLTNMGRGISDYCDDK